MSRSEKLYVGKMLAAAAIPDPFGVIERAATIEQWHLRIQTVTDADTAEKLIASAHHRASSSPDDILLAALENAYHQAASAKPIMPASCIEILERRGWRPTAKGYGFFPEGALRPTIMAEGTRVRANLMAIPLISLGETLNEWDAVRDELAEFFGIEPDGLGSAEPLHVPSSSEDMPTI